MYTVTIWELPFIEPDQCYLLHLTAALQDLMSLPTPLNWKDVMDCIWGMLFPKHDSISELDTLQDTQLQSRDKIQDRVIQMQH